MESYKLKKLSLLNWKGKTVSVCFGDKTIISGFNESGKTLLNKAHNWLLSSYTDANNAKNHELFDNKSEITENTPIAEVEALIEIGGCEYSLKKTARAKFTRDKEDGVMKKASSDEYAFYINDVARSASDYASFINDNICHIDVIQYCLNGEFFTNLAEDDKDKARKLLSSIVGEISDSELKGDYSIIWDLLKKGTVQGVKASTKSKRNTIEKRISILPTLISAKQEEKGKVEQDDFNGILSEIDSKKKRLTEIDEELKGSADSIKPFIEKRNEELNAISKLKEELYNKRMEYNSKQQEPIRNLNADLRDVENRNAEIERRNVSVICSFSEKEKEVERIQTRVEILSKKREELLAKNREVKSRMFDGDKCAYCGQDLPIDKIEESRNKFNEEKLQQSALIVEEGKNVSSTLKEFAERLESLRLEVSKGYSVEALESKDEIIAKIKQLELSIVPFEKTPEYAEYEARIQKMNDELTMIPQTDTDALSEEKHIIMIELESLNRKYGMKDRLTEIKAELSELEKELRSSSNEIAKLLGTENALKEYERERADVVSSRVNNLLEYTNIVMQRQQKNGDWADDCVIMNKYGVKYSTINGASRIVIASDIQRMFCKHYQVNLPVWVDNCSIIDEKNRPSYNGVQMIYIINSEEKFNVKTLES